MTVSLTAVATRSSRSAHRCPLLGIHRAFATGLSGTPMPSYGDSLESQEIWALVYYLDSLVPLEHRLSLMLALGEESRGWMALRMGRMMGHGGMMHRMRSMPMMR
jgi:hypothetical protein